MTDPYGTAERYNAASALMAAHAREVGRHSEDPDPLRYWKELAEKHPADGKTARALYAAGTFVVGDRRNLGPDDAMAALKDGPFSTEMPPVSTLALRFPSPNSVVVVRVGNALDDDARWMAFPEDYPGGERPDGPTKLPDRHVGRYFHELGQPLLLATDDTAIPEDVFREPDISDRGELPLYHGMTGCDGCGENVIPLNDSREWSGLYLCDDCQRRITEDGDSIQDLPLGAVYQDGGSDD